MKHYLQILLSSILAGVMIGIGASVFLVMKSMDLAFAGTFMFTFGLFTIIHFGFWLYTGKVGNVLSNKASYILDLLVCVIGNMLGVFLICSLLKTTRMSDSFITAASSIVDAKENDSWYSILGLAFMCGIMIYLAVKGHEKCPYSLGKVLLCFLAISVFIMCGFEHCVANVAYYTYAGVFTFKSLGLFLLMIIGNALGSIVFDGALRVLEKLKEEKKEFKE